MFLLLASFLAAVFSRTGDDGDDSSCITRSVQLIPARLTTLSPSFSAPYANHGFLAIAASFAHATHFAMSQLPHRPGHCWRTVGVILILPVITCKHTFPSEVFISSSEEYSSSSSEMPHATQNFGCGLLLRADDEWKQHALEILHPKSAYLQCKLRRSVDRPFLAWQETGMGASCRIPVTGTCSTVPQYGRETLAPLASLAGLNNAIDM